MSDKYVFVEYRNYLNDIINQAIQQTQRLKVSYKFSLSKSFYGICFFSTHVLMFRQDIWFLGLLVEDYTCTRAGPVIL